MTRADRPGADDDRGPHSPSTLDLEAHGVGDMVCHARTATFASNWRAVLAADASIGLALIAIGGLIVWQVRWYGWLLVAVGVAYLAMVARRYLQWRWLRQQVGL